MNESPFKDVWVRKTLETFKELPNFPFLSFGFGWLNV